MNEYGTGLGSSKSRNNLKSPVSHNIQEAKTYKKKYEQTMEAVGQQKNRGEKLQLRLQGLLQTVKNQQKQLQKQDDISEVLLDRIKTLKNAVAELNAKKNSEESSYDDKNLTKSNKSNNSNEECSIKVQPAVGGYFGLIFK